MAVNKVEVGGEVKLDLTEDTVTPENLLSGATAHNAAGEKIVGSAIKAPVGPYVDVLEWAEDAGNHYKKEVKLYNHNAFYAHEFDWQASLESIDWSDPSNRITVVEYDAFYAAPLPESLPDSITTLQPACFEAALLGSTFHVPAVTELPDGCFANVAYQNNDTPTNFIFPSGLTTLGEQCFAVSELTSIVLPNSLTTIGQRAFKSCLLTSMPNIPSGVHEIPDSCFNNCGDLLTAEIPNHITKIGPEAFAYTGLSTITIPESVTQLGKGSFTGNYNLTSAVINAHVTEIPIGFMADAPLTSLILPNTVQVIGASAFQMHNLSDITIPASVIEIQDYALASNTELATMTCLAITPPTLGDKAFIVGSTAVIKVPAASLAAYKAATNWSIYADNMVGV